MALSSMIWVKLIIILEIYCDKFKYDDENENEQHKLILSKSILYYYLNLLSHQKINVVDSKQLVY